MRTDTEIRVDGLHALVEVLGAVEAERFINLILREPFDYTKWQRQLWRDRNVVEISKAAMDSKKVRDIRFKFVTFGFHGIPKNQHFSNGG